MPNCSKCNTAQSKLNKGALCKKCFINKINHTDDISSIIDEPIEIDIINERSVIDLIKAQMAKEVQWNIELNQILKDQIEYLKSEIKEKTI